jgi:hypothetical protein
MPRLSDISASPTLRDFAQGAAQSAIMPVADFLAPTVSVPVSVGRYKKYTEKNRFRIPNTLRAMGGRATELKFDASDETFNCEPHALDYPVDNLEKLEERGMQDTLREGAVAIAEVAALAHEKTVVDAALASVGAGTAKAWTAGTTDPVKDIDDAILAVIKAAGYGSLMGVGILFGAGAFNVFKNASLVRGRFISGGAKGGVSLATVTEANASQLFLGNNEVRSSYMVYDTTPEGKTASLDFILDGAVLIFARKKNPTRRDPSFMKTFRLMGKFMVPGSYAREDGRAEVAKFDWSEDVKVVNSAACVRLNPT